jgi:branched-chain amino acid transport system ATP-binding protein
MLRVEKLHAAYGRLEALHGLDLFVPPGKIVALLGSNGAGKSTTLGAIAGMVRVTSGFVDLDGKRITGLRTHQIVQSGVVMVPQERELFGDLSVAENLEMGAISVRDQQVRKEQLETMLTKFPRLRERYRQRAATLSGGERAMLAVARGVMAKPKVLLLDEPSAGLAPLMVTELGRILAELRDGRQTILLVEQNVHMALSIADHVFIVQNGRIAFDADVKEIGDPSELFHAYMA